MDEQNQVTRNLKTRDLQMASVILDFKELKVLKATLNGVVVPKDFNKIVEYYYQHYKSTMDRLFKENGWEIEIIKNEEQNESTEPETNPS